jgi:hypothetical protein
MVYMCRSLGGCCSSVVWTIKVSWSRRSIGVIRLLCSNTLCVRRCWLGPASPGSDLQESSWWQRRLASGADVQA